jgi:hypothetical protein
MGLTKEQVEDFSVMALREVWQTWDITKGEGKVLDGADFKGPFQSPDDPDQLVYFIDLPALGGVTSFSLDIAKMMGMDGPEVIDFVVSCLRSALRESCQHPSIT